MLYFTYTFTLAKLVGFHTVLILSANNHLSLLAMSHLADWTMLI